MKMQAKIEENINYAAVHLGMQNMISNIRIDEIEMDKIVVKISATPGFMFECKKEYAVENASILIEKPELLIDDAFYRSNLIEGAEAEIKIEVYSTDDPDKVLCFQNEKVHLQAYLHWDGKHYMETIPGFMQPNDPLVHLVLHKAGEYAAEMGVVMCGYQTDKKENIIAQTSCIFKALVDMQIHYYNPQASFELYGQKIRVPHQVLHEDSKQGTCLDLAILFATCLEATGLNAMVVIIQGHAFAGVWTKEVCLHQPRVTVSSPSEWEAIKSSLEDFTPVECTLFTDYAGSTFEFAVSSAENKMPYTKELIDVYCARKNGIVPVYTYTDKPICETDLFEKEAFLRQEFSKDTKTKLECLCEQAVDITSRNRLLNCEAEKTILNFQIETRKVLNEGLKEEELNQLMQKCLGKKKDRDMVRELYNKNRRAMRENGSSNLYISMNELRWQPENAGSGKHYSAVMYLCPAEIYRNGRGDYMLRVNTEQIIFNPSLKVLLSQGYQLDSRRLIDHPTDEYENQMKLFSFLIEHQKGWSIKENVGHLSLFAVPEEAIVNGLYDPELMKHEIVQGILNGEMSWNDDEEDELPNKNNEIQKRGEQQDDYHLNDHTKKVDGIKDLYVYNTDSSQSSIIESAFRKKAQLVVGPAGNGKTQTIVNILLEAYKLGKSVLFVTEKAPAQDVAYQRLNEVLDGLFNIRITGNMTTVQKFTNQIKITLDYLEQGKTNINTKDLSEVKKQYQACCDYIENYYSLMTEERNCGKTLEELVDMYAGYDDCHITVDIDDHILEKPFIQLLQQTTLLLSVMDANTRTMGKYSEYIRYDNLRGTKEQHTYALAKKAVDLYDTLEESAQEFRAMLFDTTDKNKLEKKELSRLIVFARLISECKVYHKSVEDLVSNVGVEDSKYKEQLVDEFKKLETYGKYVPALVKNSQKEKCRQLLRNVFSTEETRNIMNLFEEDVKNFWIKMDDMKFVLDEQGNTVPEQNEKTIDWIKSYMEKILSACLKLEISELETRSVKKVVKNIMEGNDIAVKQHAINLLMLYHDFEGAQKEASKVIVRNEEEFTKHYPTVLKKDLLTEWMEYRNHDINRSRSAYDKIVIEMTEEGYTNLVKQIEQLKVKSKVSNEDIEKAVAKSWVNGQINRILEEESEGANFDYYKFQNKVKYLNIDEAKIRENLRDEIKGVILNRMPNIEQGVCHNKEFGELQKLIRQKNTTIRMFFEKTGNIMQKIFPCMIMDPVSVAKFIPNDFNLFDLVIIDEGSQMPTYNALIPISHGKRCMIFGDEKQLQVMDEFKKKINDEEDNLVGRESILTSAYITSMPRPMLRFHYRSENESLIAFSNKKYYNNSIITFPSCDTKVNGVHYEFVENGVYDIHGCKGTKAEALAVIKKIKEVFLENDNKEIHTLGVITLNIHQRDLILSMLTEETKQDAKLGKIADDYVDVVNLESCQGKEWDYVIIAPGFGKDEKGQFHMGFGALNKEGGEKRLNVMLTRAKKEMVVITCIEPYMLANAKSEGVKDFREFLKYAKGEISLDSRTHKREERGAGIINSVASALERKGYTVHTNIGSSEFKVDIGIVSKENKDKYELGIILDHFHDLKSNIHDRELTYTKSLEDKGWRIYRLRYINWKEDAQTEVLQILNMLEA